MTVTRTHSRHVPPDVTNVQVAPWTSRAGATPVPETPYLRLDVGVALRRYRELATALPGTRVHYAVKANPHPALLAALRSAGAAFDVASPGETRQTLSAGAIASELLYSNPVKRRSDIAAAAAMGVRLFAVDSPEEVAKVAEAAPGRSVFCRIVTSGLGADWPLSRKYGCTPDEAVEALRLAARLGLEPAGVSFHVGSQQRDPAAWRAPITAAAGIFESLRGSGLRPWLLDMGGGFPADHEGDAPSLADYGRAITGYLGESFGQDHSDWPARAIEPGRGVVGDAGTLVASVVGVLRRGTTRWVYLDAGIFTGLVETLDEAIRYRIVTARDEGPTGPCVLAGPTCDSADVLYQRIPVQLPLDLREGDVVELRSAGAYTASYSTVGFNGFAPLRTILADIEPAGT
ncbi:MAG: type III PLP-dependent enzyme [Nocardioidaceae bacterium]